MLSDAFLCGHLRADKGKAYLPAPLGGAEFCLAVVFLKLKEVFCSSDLESVRV